MHDAEAKKVTVEALPHIIDYLVGQGYEFKNFYEIIKYENEIKFMNMKSLQCYKWKKYLKELLLLRRNG